MFKNLATDRNSVLRKCFVKMKAGCFLMMSDIDGNYNGSHNQINILHTGHCFYMTQTEGKLVVRNGLINEQQLLDMNLTKYHNMQLQSIHEIEVFTFEKGTNKLQSCGEASKELVIEANKIIEHSLLKI